MTTPTSVNAFLGLVCKSGVLDKKQLADRFPDIRTLPDEPHKCATALVRAGLLTNFQARQLLAGKTRGLVLGPYKILSPVGQGGMGVVYLAEHTSLHRKVALKILPADKAKDKLALERFLREARSAAALDHPNIVRLFDIGTALGVNYLVMEFVEGTTLQALMESTGPLHYVQAVQYVSQTAAGLQHAHERGFIHRDIKPSNLILNKEGMVKLLDMGLARSFQDESDNLTEILGTASDLAGSIDFVAPEQALGQTLDARVDVYSLGVTFFALMTGHPPYQGTTAQKLVQHQLNEPPKLAKLRASLPPGLGDVLAKMLAKRADDRYQSAQEVIDALGPWLSQSPTGTIAKQETKPLPVTVARHQPVQPSDDEDVDESVEPASRHSRRLMYAGVAGALSVVLIGAGVILLSGKSRSPQTPLASSPPARTTSGETPAVGPAPPKTFRVAEARRFEGMTEQVERLALSRDGKLLAGCGSRGTVVVWDVASGGVRQTLAGHNGPVHFASFSPDGTRLVAAGAKEPVARVWDIASGTQVAKFDMHTDAIWVTAYTPDGGQILSLEEPGKMFLWNSTTADVVRSVDLGTKSHMAALSQDGGTVAACGPGGGTFVSLWDTNSGEVRRVDTGINPRAVAFSPDDRLLLVAGSGTKQSQKNTTAQLIDRGTGQPLRSLQAGGGLGMRTWVAFSPSGRTCVASGIGNRVQAWATDTGAQLCDFIHDTKVSVTTTLFVGEKQLVTSGYEGTVILWTILPEDQ